MVEFAIVLPMFCLLLFGIVEFGMALNDVSGARQGVRDAARQGSVVNFGSTTSCGITGMSGPPSANIQRLMCLTKAQIGNGNQVRVKVKFMNAGLTADSPTFAAGNGLVICAIQPIQSRTGMFTPIVSGKYIRAKNVFRIEQNSALVETAGQETDPSGQNWAWCTF